MAIAIHIGRVRETRLNSVRFSTLSFAIIVLYATLQVSCVRAFFPADETLTGSVEGGKFAQYSVSKAGRVTITVVPKQGDPDVYVGENGTEPDYDLDRHSYQSTTCGVERLVVPSFAVRPIGIGIYGHPSHEYSIYELNVRIDEELDQYEDMIHGDQSFDSIDDETYGNVHDASESRDYYGDRAAGSEHYSRTKGRRKASSSRSGSTSTSEKGGNSITSDSGNSGGSVPDDTTDWEDWEEFPLYNILLTLIRLFWEMLLTL